MSGGWDKSKTKSAQIHTGYLKIEKPWLTHDIRNYREWVFVEKWLNMEMLLFSCGVSNFLSYSFNEPHYQLDEFRLADHQASQAALMAKNLLANAQDIRETVSIPGSGRSPGGGHGNAFQCSCLENSMERGTWWSTVHRVAKSWTQLKWLSKHSIIPTVFDDPLIQRKSSCHLPLYGIFTLIFTLLQRFRFFFSTPPHPPPTHLSWNGGGSLLWNIAHEFSTRE